MFPAVPSCRYHVFRAFFPVAAAPSLSSFPTSRPKRFAASSEGSSPNTMHCRDGPRKAWAAARPDVAASLDLLRKRFRSTPLMPCVDRGSVAIVYISKFTAATQPNPSDAIYCENVDPNAGRDRWQSPGLPSRRPSSSSARSRQLPLCRARVVAPGPDRLGGPSPYSLLTTMQYLFYLIA